MNKLTPNKLIMVVLLVGLLGLIFYVAAGSSRPTVSAQGISSIEATPDLVSVNINILTEGATAQEAQKKNKEISDNLTAELKRAGFENNELNFVNYYVYPTYNWEDGEQELTGYSVSQQLVVKTNKTDKVPPIIDATIKAGGLVSYINFELSQESQQEYKAQALEEAGKDAKLKAESIAAGVGKKLGKLVSVESQDFFYPGPIVYYENSAAQADEALLKEKADSLEQGFSPSEIDVSATISVKYYLSWI